MFDVGRICLKVAGREAGRFCVVVKRLDDNFVLVTGPRSVTRVKRRKCNISHLEPLPEMVKIKDDAPDEEIVEAFEGSSIFEKLKIPRPERRHEAGERREAGEAKPEKKVKKKAKETSEQK